MRVALTIDMSSRKTNKTAVYDKEVFFVYRQARGYDRSASHHSVPPRPSGENDSEESDDIRTTMDMFPQMDPLVGWWAASPTPRPTPSPKTYFSFTLLAS
jgi:hypothetical protein